MGIGGELRREAGPCGDVEAEGPALGRGQHAGQRGGLHSPICVGDGESGDLQSLLGKEACSGKAPPEGARAARWRAAPGWVGRRPARQRRRGGPAEEGGRR